ncbi:DNA-binding protein [Georgfuchsia toluolica]|uniref:DNA-binding protein n=1 Tax=Georgfuchsia toluolica TaxID=424218 RepID=A0A916N041_9PROT|nr:helix-hairpin-helix domain-containing protein [Georgfuchsia toluolica]CAG4883523.1 DNA-binding protein [Georgfuchsia toluolica]
MKYHFISVALAAATVLSLGVTPSFADNKADAPQAATSKTKASPNSVVSETKRKPVAKVKLVDINSAEKKELMTLPGISDTEADKIIAGRPYLTKAHLTTRNIVSRAVYEKLKTLVIAKQNKATAAKVAEMQKQAEKKKH